MSSRAPWMADSEVMGFEEEVKLDRTWESARWSVGAWGRSEEVK
jgi:hypothetical protein